MSNGSVKLIRQGPLQYQRQIKGIIHKQTLESQILIYLSLPNLITNSYQAPGRPYEIHREHQSFYALLSTNTHAFIVILQSVMRGH